MRYTLTVLFLALLAPVDGHAQPVPLNQTPSRIIGHPLPEQFTLNSTAPNLVEGREFSGPWGIALDNEVNPPYVYVSDAGNHRVLGWRNSTAFRNGQPADVVIGQTSLYRTSAGGPSVSGSTATATGLNTPTGLAVYRGDLYIVDGGNHRIVRYRKPFNNIGNQLPDLHIGQVNFGNARANYSGGPDRQGLSLGANDSASIAFDANGNLWVNDVGNRRILQFLAADVAAGGGPLQAALEIGQLNFTSVQSAVTSATRTKADAFGQPSAIAFDPAGRLYVTDTLFSGSTAQLSRVLVFNPPFANGMPASRMMGVFPGNAPTQDALDKTAMLGTEGVFFLPGSKMGVVDSLSSRILIFDTIDRWPEEATLFSPQATGVVGQADFHSRGRNSSTGSYITVASARSFSAPTAVAFTGSELFVVDSGNNRVVVLPFSNGSFGPATRVLGQDFFTGQAANLIEGREFYFLNGETGIAIDNSSDPPHLYISDSGNNRVLGFRDIRRLQAGAKADLVIGQADFTTNLCNFQGLNHADSGNPDRPTQSSLCLPSGLAVDSNGNLYVADTLNSRVLRFPAPFAHQGQLPQADLVIGQRNFTTKITDPSPSTMAAPLGVSFVTDNGLIVSDTNHNRVLYFAYPPGQKTFTAGDNGRAANKVFGQPDFFTAARTNTTNGMSSPRHVSADSEARPYVSDTGNNRILIFDQINSTADAGAPAAKIITGFTSPRAVYVNQATGEAWVGDQTNTVKKYPKFETLLLNQASTGSVATILGLAVAQDSAGNAVVADGTHRVAFYYPGLQAVNAANLLANRELAPGTIGSICSPGSACGLTRVNEFGDTTALLDSVPNPIPLPRTLGDIQVLFNGEPAPLYYVSPSQINFVVPWSAPTSGTAELQVVQASTGRIYAAGAVAMDTYSPGILMQQYSGQLRQAAVLNQDNTINSPTNPAPRGTYVQIFATGQGPIPNPPPDGAPPQAITLTPFTPRAVVGACFVDLCPKDIGEGVPPSGYIAFSGLSPEFPGVWQVNVYVPKTQAPGNQIPIAIIAGSKGNVDPGSGFQVTIAVK